MRNQNHQSHSRNHNQQKTGGDGIPRVGDVVTFTGSYYNDSWGMSPRGSRFSGQPGAVVIDSYTAREYGGNGRTTGDFKIHIKSAHDPNYSDLGWVRLSQISGYEKVRIIFMAISLYGQTKTKTPNIMAFQN